MRPVAWSPGRAIGWLGQRFSSNLQAPERGCIFTRCSPQRDSLFRAVNDAGGCFQSDVSCEMRCIVSIKRLRRRRPLASCESRMRPAVRYAEHIHLRIKSLCRHGLVERNCVGTLPKCTTRPNRTRDVCPGDEALGPSLVLEVIVRT